MNTLTHKKRCAVVRCLVDGCSILAATRITGVAKNYAHAFIRDIQKRLINRVQLTTDGN